MLKHLVAAFIVVFLWCAPAFAQTHNGAYTVTTCGTAPNGFNFSGANGYSAGGWYPSLMDVNGNGCVTGSLSLSGSVSNAGSLNNSSTNLGSVSYNYGQNAAGTAWLPIVELPYSGVNYLGIDAAPAGNLITAINSGVVTTGSAVPATALYMGLNFGGNGIGWTGDTNGYGNVNVKSNSALIAGSAIIGKVGIDQTTPGTTNGVQTLTGSTTAVTGTVTVAPSAASTGGSTPFNLVTTASTNSTQVGSAGAHLLYDGQPENPTTSFACLYVYDVGTAPTVGTTAYKHVYPLGAASSAGVGVGGLSFSHPVGEGYVNGIWIAVTGGSANTCPGTETANAVAGINIPLSYK